MFSSISDCAGIFDSAGSDSLPLYLASFLSLFPLVDSVDVGALVASVDVVVVAVFVVSLPESVNEESSADLRRVLESVVMIVRVLRRGYGIG